MKIELAANIRTLRKERNLTQEQLAEALGVTTGAVHKWETGLSLPELEMIIQIADFFDSAVDALLGYGIRDDRREAVSERLAQYARRMDPKALAEAEDALKKYPNDFAIVHDCASIALVFGTWQHDKALIRKGLELYKRSLLLLPQNTDKEISEHTVYGEISAAYYALGEIEKSLELMKNHNRDGIFNDQIGVFLAVLKRSDEAQPFLSDALLSHARGLLNAAMGLGIVFTVRGDDVSAENIRRWGLEITKEMKGNGGTDYIDRLRAEFLVQLAQSQLRTKGRETALKTLQEAAETAGNFDRDPDFGIETIRYMAEEAGNICSYDLMGATVAEAIDTLLKLMDDAELTALWRKAAGNE